jgi:hypothetical protein
MLMEENNRSLSIYASDEDYKVFVKCKNCGKMNDQKRSTLQYTDGFFSQAYFKCDNCNIPIFWEQGDISFDDAIFGIERMRPMNQTIEKPDYFSALIIWCIICALVASLAYLLLPAFPVAVEQTQNPIWLFGVIEGAAFIYILGKMRIIRVR